MRKLLHHCRIVIVCLACLASSLPLHVAVASPPAGIAGPMAGIVDVRLDAQGGLRGTLVDGLGQPLAAQPVILQATGGVASGTQTDAAGCFTFQSVRGGVYRLLAGDGVVTCRVWTHAAAPPVAADRLAVVTGQSVVRGQQPFSAVFTNPLFIGLVIATAIVVPLAVRNAHDGS